MKLKTLKDYDLTQCLELADIRQEAIKWIKLFNKYQGKVKCNDGHDFEWEGATQDIYVLKVWIKHFFNIEESDLK